MRRAEDGEAVGLAAVDQLAQDQAGLDGLADADIVGDQQPHDGEAQRHQQRHELIGARLEAEPRRRAERPGAAPKRQPQRLGQQASAVLGRGLRPLSAARSARAAPARVRAPDGSPARRPRRRRADAGTASRRPATAAPPIRARARRRDRPERTWRSCSSPQAVRRARAAAARLVPRAGRRWCSRAPRRSRASQRRPVRSRLRPDACARRAASVVAIRRSAARHREPAGPSAPAPRGQLLRRRGSYLRDRRRNADCAPGATAAT